MPQHVNRRNFLETCAAAGAALAAGATASAVRADGPSQPKPEKKTEQRKLKAEHGVVCSVPGERLGYFGWPTLCRMGDGTLLIASSGFRMGHACPYGKTVLNISRDGGQTWSFPRVVYDAAIDARDAGILWLGGQRLLVSAFGTDPQEYRAQQHVMNRFSHDPKAMAFWLMKPNSTDPRDAKKHPRSWVQFSDDGGTTWQPPIAVPVSAPHGPIRLRNGNLFYLGSDTRDPPWGSIRAMQSGDGGRTWKVLSTLPTFPGIPSGLPGYYWEPYSVELPGGRILGLIRVEGRKVVEAGLSDFSMLQTESADGGKTWGPLRSLGFYGAPPHLLRHSSGTLVLSYSYRRPPYGQRIALSRDDGKTWQHDWILRDDGPSWDLGYPSTVEMADGSLLTAYYQQIRSPSENCSLLWSRWRLPE